MVYIGTRPAFSLNENFVEVHIPGFCGDLYGEKMAVLLTDFIRPEIKFECFGDVLKHVSKGVRLQAGTCMIEFFYRIYLDLGLSLLLGVVLG